MKFAWLPFTFLSLDNRFQFMTSQLHKLALFSWNEWKEYNLYKIFIWFPQGSIFPKKWDFPSKNTGVGYHFLLQRIFLTQDQIQVSALQEDSLLSEPPGKPSLR